MSGGKRRWRALALAAVLSAACHPRVSTPEPPFPLGEGEPHAEPDVAGVFHVVRRGQTLWRISRAYGISEGALAEANDLRSPGELRVGEVIFVPGAERTLEVPPAAGAAPEADAPLHRARFAWPLRGVLVSRFGERGGEHHDGIDIAAPEGAPIEAAARGTVIFAGTQHGYGNLAIVDHGGGEATVYAHCEKLLVHVGEAVSAGEVIARVGRTGRATGPHLHFEVREHARPRNPLLFLPTE